MDTTEMFAWERLVGFFGAGGPVVAILAVMSVMALTIVLVKLWQFRSARVSDLRSAGEALQLHRAGQSAAAVARAERSRNPAAQAVARALRGVERGLPEAKVREEVTRYGRGALESLRTGLRPLEVIGSLAPLLGLFGTVLGMIEAFRQLEAAGNRVDPSVLSGGIWEALLTTAVGLAVAIPVVALLNWLERRIERLAHRMDDCVTQVFTVDLSETASAPNEDEAEDEPARFRAAGVARR
ncbi:MotA/TolQ/ExbB proton channel family protein [Spiribacter halobius]|uniref:Flagellar motor protein MotA n=1 Tax=Sediminicurvatus halobius TaxID=2182432 RepID=A0A2U2N3V1_9GAMM|nr:MotA/TolQ/ExbB proton channel family protein [Spiribacter halobius]PWG63718.1 flagellar motor protein MotA [Spiribacter halobius]UEX79855.1 MotA/TolQ/ExbB proton channel family protein [Spiribacter halobius]